MNLSRVVAYGITGSQVRQELVNGTESWAGQLSRRLPQDLDDRLVTWERLDFGGSLLLPVQEVGAQGSVAGDASHLGSSAAVSVKVA